MPDFTYKPNDVLHYSALQYKGMEFLYLTFYMLRQYKKTPTLDSSRIPPYQIPLPDYLLPVYNLNKHLKRVYIAESK